MEKKIRILITLTGIIIFLFHTTCTFIFNFEKVTKNPYVKWIVFKYMFPVFNQNNKVFAPDPPLHKQHLAVQLHTPEGWSRRINYQQRFLQGHYANRLGQAGIELRLNDYLFFRLFETHARSEYYAHQENDSTNFYHKRDSIIRQSEAFTLAQRYFRNELSELIRKNGYDSIKVYCVKVYPQKYESGLTSVKSTELVLDFPAFSLTGRP